jgi:hypothetical protein
LAAATDSGNGFTGEDTITGSLTEDIDSSFRVIEQGYKIASDPYLISRWWLQPD